MKIIDKIKQLLKAYDRIVCYDYPYTHLNINIFDDASINFDESSHSTYTIHPIKPILTISFRYPRSNEVEPDDIEESDYDEIIEVGIEQAYENDLTDIDLNTFIEQEYQEEIW